jgi:WD40 repeat protein
MSDPLFPCAADLVAALQSWRLLEPTQLKELEQLLLPQCPETRLLASALVRRDLLTPFQVNQLFQGKGATLRLGSYVLLEKLGEGGMGTVFKARDTRLGRIVALKVIRRDRVGGAQAIERFRREIRAVAQLDHPHIVHAYDADEVAGTLLLAMEFVDGTDLARLVQERGPLPPELAREYVRQAALGLEHAHQRGIVHRDVKPNNLLLSPQGMVKLLDLGLARLVEPAGEMSSPLTGSGMVMGTPDYIAPEQARDAHHVDARADLYSLGCTLYFLLSGRVPFPDGTPTEKILWHMSAQPEPLEKHCPEVPPGVAAVVKRLMVRDPAQRFQSAAELVTALELPPPGETTPEQANPWIGFGTGDTALEIVSPRHWRRWQLAGVGILLACVLGLGLALLLGREREGAPAPSGPPVVQVHADRPWQDTGIDVAEGEPVTIIPEGVWRKGSGHLACNARGLDKEPHDRAVWPEAALLCLLARVGEEDEPTPVLGKQQLVPRHSGRLYLQANDLGLSNNHGHLEVTIDGGRRTDQALLAPRLLRPQEAAAQWRTLRAQDLAATAKLGAVLDFRQRFAGTPAALDAGEFLGVLFEHLPWSLDRLDPAKVPAEERDTWRLAGLAVPKELVAVLGESRLRHWGTITGLAWQPGGGLLASSGEDGIRLWEARTFAPRAVLRGHRGRVNGVAFAPGGKLLASAGGDATVRLWDVSGEEVKEAEVLRETAGGFAAVVFSAGGDWLAAAQDNRVRLWRLGPGKATAGPVLKGHNLNVFCLAAAPDGKWLASGGFDRTVRLWRMTAAGAEQGPVLSAISDVSGLAFADAKTLVASLWSTATLYVWDLGGAEPKARPRFVNREGLDGLAIASDGQTFASGYRYGGVRLYRLTKGQPERGLFLDTGPGWVVPMGFSPDSRVFAAGGLAARVIVWDLAGSKERMPPHGHRGGVTAVTFSPDGRRLLSGSTDETVRLWEMAGAEMKERTVFNHSCMVRAVAFAPDGKALASAGEGGVVRLWRPGGDSTKPAAQLDGPTGSVQAVSFAPDGRTVCFGGSDLRLWECGEERTKEREVVRGAVATLSFSPDGRALAVGAESNVFLHPVRALREKVRVGGHGSAVTALAYSPNGRTLASAGSDSVVRLWHLTRTGARPGPVLHGHTEKVLAVAFAPDGQVIASTGMDATVRLWEASSGKPLREIRLPGPAQGVAFALDGRHLATANSNGTLFILRLKERPRGEAP